MLARMRVCARTVDSAKNNLPLVHFVEKFYRKRYCNDVNPLMVRQARLWSSAAAANLRMRNYGLTKHLYVRKAVRAGGQRSVNTQLLR